MKRKEEGCITFAKMDAAETIGYFESALDATVICRVGKWL
jgi:hypothetical protein